MYDGTVAKFEMLKRADTLQVVAVTADKKIILLKEQQPTKKPFLGLPGGRRDPGEPSLAAAKRELKEETGYSAKTWRLWYVERPYSKIEWHIFVFVAHGATKTTRPKLDPGEKIIVTKISFTQFLKLATNSRFHEPSLQAKLLKANYSAKLRANLKKLLFQ